MITAHGGDLFRLVFGLLFVLGTTGASSSLAADNPHKTAPPSDWIPTDNETFLETLKAKDKELDCVRVSVWKNKTIKRSPLEEHLQDSFTAYKYGDDPPPRPESYEPFEQETSATLVLTLRGEATTLEQTTMFDGRGERLAEPYRCRISNASGTTECSTEMQGEKMTVQNVTPLDERGLFYEAKMELEFALGVGFGTRLESIEKIEREGEMARVFGTMKIWSRDSTSAVLLIDSDLIVREAVLEANTDGHITTFEVQSFGSITFPHGKLAETSTYRRTASGIFRDGRFVQRSRVIDEYSTSNHQVTALDGAE